MIKFKLTERGLFFSLFLLCLFTKLIIVFYMQGAGIGWDENIYLKHANTFSIFFSSLDTGQFLQNYFVVNDDFVRFFPPGSPIGYAIFGALFDDNILGARIYNSIWISIGTVSSYFIVLNITKNKIIPTFAFLITLLSPLHNFYGVFLWTEGVQFGCFMLLIYLSLKPVNLVLCLIMAFVMTVMVISHGSSLLLAILFISYLLFFVYSTLDWRAKLKHVVIIFSPSLIAIVLIGLVAKPVVGEFVILTSETIPMRSLANPPSSYKQTWKDIHKRANVDNSTLSASSSAIANEYIAEIGLIKFFQRGWWKLKASLAQDSFPLRHFNNNMWENIDKHSFDSLYNTAFILHFITFFSLCLLAMVYPTSSFTYLLWGSVALKVITVFVTGVGMTRYFSSLFMLAMPFALVAFNELRVVSNSSYYNKTIKVLFAFLFTTFIF